MTDPKTLLKSLEEHGHQKRKENERNFTIYIRDRVSNKLNSELDDIYKEIHQEFEKFISTKIPERVIIAMGLFAVGIVYFVLIKSKRVKNVAELTSQI